MIDDSQGERDFRPNHGKTDSFRFGKVRKRINIGGADLDAGCQSADPGIARSTKNLRYPGALPQFPDQGMLPAPRTNNQNLHQKSPRFLAKMIYCPPGVIGKCPKNRVSYFVTIQLNAKIGR